MSPLAAVLAAAMTPNSVYLDCDNRLDLNQRLWAAPAITCAPLNGAGDVDVVPNPSDG
jgi:hypothetical protein